MAYFNNLTVGGTAKFLQDVKWPGLKSSVDELNYLHTETTVIDGFLITTTSGESGSIDGWVNGSKPLGLKIGNTYTLTFENEDGTFIEENIVATDISSDIGISGAIGLDSVEMDDIIFMDNVHFDWHEATPLTGDCTWVYPPGFDLISIKIEGLDKNGNKLTREQKIFNTIPQENIDLYEAHNPRVFFEAPIDEITFTPESLIDTGDYYGFMPGSRLGLIPGETYTVNIVNLDTSEELPTDIVCELVEVTSNPITGEPLQVPGLPLSDSIFYAIDNVTLLTSNMSTEKLLMATDKPQDQGWAFLTGTIGSDVNVEITISGPGLKGRYYQNTSLPANINGYANYLQGLELTGRQLQEKIDNAVGEPGTDTCAEIFNDSDNIASGSYSHAEGYQTKATESHAHAEGSGTEANGRSSHAEGGSSIAAEAGDHAEGLGCETIAYTGGHYNPEYGRHVEGTNCTAGTASEYSPGAHAEGRLTTAIGLGASSHGDLTTANGTAQAVFGRCNVICTGQTWSYGSTDTLFIIGNGQRSTGNSSDVGTRSNAFRVTAAGDVMGTKAFTASGADYAEYYEWADGNPDNEDRRGKFVTFAEGNKIRLANNTDEYILGVISANPSVIGNGYTDNWQGMYLTDIYGQKMTRLVEIPEKEIFDDNGNLLGIEPAQSYTEFIVNPEYDPNLEYKGRNERQEWGIVGTHGQLVVNDDGSCQVNKYCKVANNGTAIYSEEKTEYRVVERLDDTHIRIVIK